MHSAKEMHTTCLKDGVSMPLHSLYRARVMPVAVSETDYKASFTKLEHWVKQFNECCFGHAEVWANFSLALCLLTYLYHKKMFQVQ